MLLCISTIRPTDNTHTVRNGWMTKAVPAELEAVVYLQLVKKPDSYKTMTDREKAPKANPKITALQAELAMRTTGLKSYRTVLR